MILQSPLSPEACAANLRASLDSGITSTMLGTKPFIGKVSQSSLEMRRRISYHNPFQTYLTATMQPSPQGTVIVGEFKMHTFVKAFMIFWFAGLAFGGGPIFLNTAWSVLVGERHDLNDRLLSLLIPVGMVAFGIALLKAGRYIARHEEKILTDHLIGVLEARVELPHQSSAVR